MQMKIMYDSDRVRSDDFFSFLWRCPILQVCIQIINGMNQNQICEDLMPYQLFSRGKELFQPDQGKQNFHLWFPRFLQSREIMYGRKITKLPETVLLKSF